MNEENFYEKINKEIDRKQTLVSALQKILKSYQDTPKLKNDEKKRKKK